MSAHVPSVLSLTGAALYLVVAGAAFVAARHSPPRANGFELRRNWLLVGAFFLLFALMRLLAVEDVLREFLRETLASLDLREGRRSIQLPLSLAAIALAAIGLFPILRRITRRGLTSSEAAIEWAWLAIAGMIALIALRLISLHAVDQLLFGPSLGPLRINWMLDIGLSALAFSAAISFIWQRSRTVRQG